MASPGKGGKGGGSKGGSRSANGGKDIKFSWQEAAKLGDGGYFKGNALINRARESGNERKLQQLKRAAAAAVAKDRKAIADGA